MPSVCEETLLTAQGALIQHFKLKLKNCSKKFETGNNFLLLDRRLPITDRNCKVWRFFWFVSLSWSTHQCSLFFPYYLQLCSSRAGDSSKGVFIWVTKCCDPIYIYIIYCIYGLSGIYIFIYTYLPIPNNRPPDEFASVVFASLLPQNSYGRLGISHARVALISDIIIPPLSLLLCFLSNKVARFY